MNNKGISIIKNRITIRKFLIIVIFIILLISTVCSIQIIKANADSSNDGGQPITFYTPKGTPVEYTINEEESDGEYGNKDTLADLLGYDAEAIAPSSTVYNCHSYAWYSQTTTNGYWLGDPSPYYEDGSYYEVTDPQVGDIICYFNRLDNNLHSGVIVEVDDTEQNLLDSLTVISKWGELELFKHRADECSYMIDTTYNRFFRSATSTYDHEHEYGYRIEPLYEKDSSGTYEANRFTHKSHCLCGDYTIEVHNFDFGNITSNSHSSICECGYSITQAHDYVKNIYKNASYHSKTCMCGTAIDELHDYGDNEYFVVSALNHSRRCDKCGTDIVSRHVIIASQSMDHCGYCGALIDKDEYYPMLPNSLRKTANGSYILPNGIIVLMDADIEAYERGELVFDQGQQEVQTE